MTSTSTDPNAGVPTLRFSTDDFSERDRAAAWRELFGRTVVKVDLEPIVPRAFCSDMTLRQLPGLGLLFGSCSGTRLRLTNDLIDNDDLRFATGPIEGWTASQLGRDLTLQPDDGILLTNAERAHMTLPLGARFATFRVPARAVAALVPNLGATIARPIPAQSPALRMLVRYLDVLADDAAVATPELQRLAVSHVYDLLALALGATRDAAALANGRGVRAARLRQVQGDIARNLERQDLSVRQVAARHGLTPRYVQMLFECEGTTFTEFVLGQRLERAHRMLTDPALDERSVTSVAFDSGFGDPSYFNRSFRRRYGESPSGVRGAARTTRRMNAGSEGAPDAPAAGLPTPR